jgi:hypothetical protein
MRRRLLLRLNEIGPWLSSSICSNFFGSPPSLRLIVVVGKSLFDRYPEGAACFRTIFIHTAMSFSTLSQSASRNQKGMFILSPRVSQSRFKQ